MGAGSRLNGRKKWAREGESAMRERIGGEGEETGRAGGRRRKRKIK